MRSPLLGRDSHVLRQEKHRSVLVVDDNPDKLRLLEKLLTENHYKARLATSGSRALTTLRQEPPDLMWLDIMMSLMDGFEVCRQLKADKEPDGIPGALNETVAKAKAFSLSGVDDITKPFKSEEVLARVMMHLDRYKSILYKGDKYLL